MISLDPASRKPFSTYLAQGRGTCFPDIFYSFLHPFLTSLAQPPAPPTPPPATPTTRAPTITGTMTPSDLHTAASPQHQQTRTQGHAAGGQQAMRTDADEKIERVWNEWEMIQRYLDEEAGAGAGWQEGPVGGNAGEDRRPSAAETSKMGRKTGPDSIFPIKLDVPGLQGETAQGGATHGKSRSHDLLRGAHQLTVPPAPQTAPL